MGRQHLGSIPKRHKLSREQNAMQCEDRISNLPSNLIGRILSYLPTKMAVATSVLSTKWKQLWTLVTSLDFDDKFMLQCRKSNRAELRTSFVRFINRVLDRVSCLDKFRLKCCRSYDVSHVNAWIAAFIKYRIIELDLSIPLKHSTDCLLPQHLFSCRTLEVLKLDTEFMLHVPASVCLPSLKILHLDDVKFLDDDSIKRLLLACPVLDELSMNDCMGNDVRVIHVSAPVLTKLRCSCSDRDRYYPHGNYLGKAELSEYKIVIDTPALLYLELHDNVAEVYSVNNPTHIVKADIGISVEYDECHSKALTDLLMGISEVQCLHLYHDNRGVPHRIVTELPVFHNLTSLVLGEGHVAWELVSQLLVKSPSLESLVFKEAFADEEEEEEHPRQNIPSCLLLTLKVITFVEFRGNKGDLQMVEYLLKNAEVLEKLVLQCDGIAKDGLEIATKLLMLPRGSSTCQIEFVFSA